MTLAAIDVRELVGHPGASREEHVRGTLDGIGTELAGIRDDDTIEADLLLESLVEGILVSGTISSTMALRCARCLKGFDRGLTVEVQEMFVPAPDEDTDDYRLEPEGFLEPAQMVRDAMGVELPFSPLCRPDCLGLCPVCGGDRNLGECAGDHPSIDPRWAGLEQVLEHLDQN
jgi:uncharacterized protein